MSKNPSSEPDKLPNTKRLWGISAGSLILALIGGFLFWTQIESGGGMGWVGWLITGTLTGIIYGISFLISVMLFENTLEQYITSDTFSEKHDWIDLETESRSSGNSKIDTWVAHYKFARIALAMGILPLLACIYLFWFA